MSVIGRLSHPWIVSPLAAVIVAGSVGLMLAQTTARVRLTSPRIHPVAQSDWNEAQRRLLGTRDRTAPGSKVFNTVARNPELAEAWQPFAGYVVSRSSLPARDHEMLILRIGWLCRAEYEWARHSRTAVKAGLTAEEITRITRGADAEGWAEFDRLLLRAVDELHEDAFITDRTWKALAARYSEKQMMDLVFTVGEYNLVSMAINSFGVQLDADDVGFPR